MKWCKEICKHVSKKELALIALSFFLYTAVVTAAFWVGFNG